MFKLLDSTLSLVENVATVVTAPVRIAVDTANTLVKPLAEMVEEVADEIKEGDGGI